MAFKHYLEEEDDKPYFTTNSLGYYYDKMEGFAEKVEQASKTLNLTKEEIEQRIALRLAEWDKNLERFDGSVEKLLTEWVDDGTLTHVIDSTLIDQKIAPVSIKLADKTKQGLTCFELKMTPNDVSKGMDNYTKLVNAINTGIKVLVEDNYYLECLTIIPFTKNVFIQAVNEKAKLTLKEGNTFFNATSECGNIKIDGIRFENTGTIAANLFMFTGTLYFENIDITKNVFNGNISFMRYTAPKTLNPTTTKYGFGTFRFEDNEVSNTRTSFMVFISVPCIDYYIRRNKVRNFDYTFLNSGIDNTHSFPDEIYKASKKIVVEHNDVRCDNSWFGGGSNGAYYLFVLFEGQEVKYTGNHVEGIKSDFVIAIYDAYLSADKVDYSGNTWKNNICFNSAKTNNTLMKAKFGSGLKKYTNNQFIVEESFAIRLGKDPFLLKVNMFDITGPSEKWEINNNTFSVYYLTLQQSSNQGREIWIENNSFTCQYVKFPLINYRIETGIDYTHNTHRIKNNAFTVKGVIDNDKTFCLIKYSDYSNMLNNLLCNIDITNNNIKVYDMSYLVNDVRANSLNLLNNAIEVNSPTPSIQGFVASSSINEYKNVGNSVNKPNGRYSEGYFDYRGTVLEDYTIQDNGIASPFSKIGLSPNNIINKKFRYIRQYEILCSLGFLKFTATFDYYYDELTGYNMISFVDSADVTGNYKLSKTTDAGAGEGNAKNIKLTGDTGGLTLRFTNASTGNIAYLDNLPGGYKTIKVKTYSMIV